MRTYGSITFKDAAGKTAPVRIMNPKGGTELGNIAGVIEGQSNAVWTKLRVDTENGSVGTPTNATYPSVKTKAICSFRNADDEIFKCSVPAPLAANIEGGDTRYDATAGAALAASLTANTNNGTLTFLQGKLWHRSPK